MYAFKYFLEYVKTFFFYNLSPPVQKKQKVQKVKLSYFLCVYMWVGICECVCVCVCVLMKSFSVFLFFPFALILEGSGVTAHVPRTLATALLCGIWSISAELSAKTDLFFLSFCFSLASLCFWPALCQI